MEAPTPFDRLGVVKYPGSSITPGFLYHDLPFEEYAHLPVHRSGTRERVAHMARHFDFFGERGLDIGCAVGGVSFALSKEGAEMHGIDADPAAVEAAAVVALEREADCRFSVCTVPSVEFSHFIGNGGFDFALMLSSFMWIAKARGMEMASEVMLNLSRCIPVLWFETAQGPEDGMAGDATPFRSAEDVAAYLRGFYPNVLDTGVPAPDAWFQRNLFLCWSDGCSM